MDAPKTTAPGPFENPSYTDYCDRELCIARSNYENVRMDAGKKLREVEAIAEECRRTGKSFDQASTLGNERLRYLHAVRQIITITNEQQKRKGGQK